MSIQQAADDFIQLIYDTRAKRTALQYQSGLNHFLGALEKNYELDLEETNTSMIPDGAWESFFVWLNHSYQESTEKVYMTAILSFLEYMVNHRLVSSDVLVQVRIQAKQRMRRSGQRIPAFPEDEVIKVIEFALNEMSLLPTENLWDRLINLRDATLIVVMADTGLRISEACKLKRGEINFKKNEIITIGKGDKEALIEISDRAITMIKNFLVSRREVDGSTGKPLSTLPVFPRYDRPAREKCIPISSNTGRSIVKRVVSLAFSEKLAAANKLEKQELEEIIQQITPHTFRHHFVTRVLNASDGDLVLAQVLARHEDIGTTKRYAHLADAKKKRKYQNIFNEGE